MSASSATLAGRAAAEANMISECVIDSGEFTGGVWDEDLLDYTPKVPLPAYDGICEWKAATTSPREVDAAGQSVILQSPLLKLPVAASSLVAPGQEGTLTKNPLDPSLVGTKFRVSGDHGQTYGTSRRLTVEVI